MSGTSYSHNKILSALKNEFSAGRTTFDLLFLLSGLAVQVIVYVIEPQSPIAIVSGIAGIFSVILCSQGKISTFFFGFIQITTYLYLSLVEHLYAEVAMNIFYFVSQIYGIIVWRKRYKDTGNATALKTRKMKKSVFGVIFILSVLLSFLVGYLLQRYTDDTQPYLDAFTTIPAIFAQIMMVMAYKEQYFIWLMIDVFAVIMWWRAGEYCLVAQYGFWCVNCLYGYYNWSKKLV